MGDSLLLSQLSDLVEENVKFIFGLEELQPLEAETLQRAVSNHPADQLHVRHEGVQVNILQRSTVNSALGKNSK